MTAWSNAGIASMMTDDSGAHARDNGIRKRDLLREVMNLCCCIDMACPRK